MKNEERDIYTIPPNFIEGGTLLGGMFRTWNVVEAGILAVAIGGPVLSLHFSLTVRIIILCLTPASGACRPHRHQRQQPVLIFHPVA